MNDRAAEGQHMWEQIGVAFVREYYNSYDQIPKKENLANYYHFSYNHQHPRASTRDTSKAIKAHLGEIRVREMDMPKQTEALMTFEDRRSCGTAAIKEAFANLGFKAIQHMVTKVDCQPTSDGILVQVTGRLKTDDDPPHAFSQTFYIKPVGENYFIFHDIFRLSIHNC